VLQVTTDVLAWFDTTPLDMPYNHAAYKKKLYGWFSYAFARSVTFTFVCP